MNVLIRGVRVIDPLRQVDDGAQDVRIENGVITAIGRSVEPMGLPVLDMTPAAGRSWRVLCPGFIDMHAHLREPGGEEAETVASGAAAAAAGGFTQVVAMANTNPPIDDPQRVREAVARGSHADVSVLTTAALTRGIAGEWVVDIEACAQAGAVAFSDDGRNAASQLVLAAGLRRSAATGRAVLVHPEDEAALGPSTRVGSVVRAARRPPSIEMAAVTSALQALRDAGSGHLHLQHISTAESVSLLRVARHQGLDVSAEATPHHLSMWLPSGDGPESDPLRKVNPPLRTRADRDALVEAVREGVIDCIATDHAPHPAGEKALPYADAAPGMIGLETAIATCISRADLGGEWLPVLVARLTAGPWNVLRSSGLLHEPALRIAETASCVLLDADAEWTVGETPLQSKSTNTPLLGTTLRGRVLLTIHDGRAVHGDPQLPLATLVPARG